MSAFDDPRRAGEPESRDLFGAAGGPNAERAARASHEIQELVAADPRAASRLTPAIVEMLVRGVRNARSSSDRGQEGILGIRQVRDAAAALLELSPDDYRDVASLLARGGRERDGAPAAGADADAEQALILKALAARRRDLGRSTWDRVRSFFGAGARADRALGELGQFAGAIRGTRRADLINATTPIDIDDANTSARDPDHIAGPTADTVTDNDGLAQTYTTSCAVTVAQMMRAEVDPVYALQLRHESAAEQQKTVLERHGGVAVDRLREQTLEKLGQADLTGMDSQQLSVLRDLARGEKVGEARRHHLARALAALGRAGVLSEVEIASLGAGDPVKEANMYADFALADVAAPATGARYEHHDSGPDSIAADVDLIEKRVADGENVPFGIRSPGQAGGGHALLISDVRRNRDGGRRLLVSDPWSGATRWVTEADFKGGDFAGKVFDLGDAEVGQFYTESPEDG